MIGPAAVAALLDESLRVLIQAHEALERHRFGTDYDSDGWGEDYNNDEVIAADAACVTMIAKIKKLKSEAT